MSSVYNGWPYSHVFSHSPLLPFPSPYLSFPWRNRELSRCQEFMATSLANEILKTEPWNLACDLFFCEAKRNGTWEIGETNTVAMERKVFPRVFWRFADRLSFGIDFFLFLARDSLVFVSFFYFNRGWTI